MVPNKILALEGPPYIFVDRINKWMWKQAHSLPFKNLKEIFDLDGIHIK